MNKILIGLVIVIILIGGYFVLNSMNSENAEEGDSSGGQMIDEPVGSYSNLDSLEDVFSEIDSSLEYIDS